MFWVARVKPFRNNCSVKPWDFQGWSYLPRFPGRASHLLTSAVDDFLGNLGEALKPGAPGQLMYNTEANGVTVIGNCKSERRLMTWPRFRGPGSFPYK